MVVTAGPTIDCAAIHAVVPQAEVVPPISFGQALSYGLRSGDVLLIVDGLFFQHQSVRHKELLTLLSDGIRVMGSSSMGALRAAELYQFGMEGCGWVFEAYRDGILDADDEVGMVHGAAEDHYPIFVDALVNMRHTIAKAVEGGVMAAPLAADIIEAARNMPFTTRTWPRLLEVVGAPAGLAAQLRSMRVDVKHDDALIALRHITHSRQPRPVRPYPPPTVWSQRWQQRWGGAQVPTRAENDARPVSDLDVLSLLSVCSVDRWAYRPALEQVAAWHRALTHPDEDGTVRDRALRAVGDVVGQTYERALETVAHRYALTTGIIDESGFPECLRSYWLTAKENVSLGYDPVAISARVVTRTLFSAPSFPAIQYFLELLRNDPRLPEWRDMAERALAMREDLARNKPQLNLRRPDPARLKLLYATRWGADVDHIELARRGLMTEQSFYNAATLFAVAAADDKLPLIEVGSLGPELVSK